MAKPKNKSNAADAALKQLALEQTATSPATLTKAVLTAPVAVAAVTAPNLSVLHLGTSTFAGLANEYRPDEDFSRTPGDAVAGDDAQAADGLSAGFALNSADAAMLAATQGIANAVAPHDGLGLTSFAAHTGPEAPAVADGSAPVDVGADEVALQAAPHGTASAPQPVLDTPAESDDGGDAGDAPVETPQTPPAEPTVEQPPQIVDTAPIAGDDHFAGAHGAVVTGNLLDNDLDAQGPVHANAGIFTTDAGGTIEIAPDGTFRYTPPAGFSGQDSIVYSIYDTIGQIGSAALTVDVGANMPPVLTSGASGSLAEDTTGAAYAATATDAEPGSTLTYSLSGADAALFDIDSGTGIVTFKAVPDYEAPADAGGNNVYDVTISVSDGVNVASQAVAITVTNNNEAPTLTSGATATFAESGSGPAYAASATDPDTGATLSFALTGADAALFDIDAGTGVVTFRAVPDYETPADAGGNNVYDIVVSASDGTNVASQAVAITVTDVAEGPTITSGSAASFAENATGAVYVATATDADGSPLTYSLSGADAALFDIDSGTGVVTFKASPNFEAPADAGGNNVYDIVVSASDGTNVASQAVAITIGDRAEYLGLTESDDSFVDTGVTESAVFGGGGNDSLTGTDAIDVLNGNGGDDVLIGNAGSDWLVGGDGADRLLGGDGDDLLEFGAGDDIGIGGAGTDITIYNGSWSDYAISYDAATDVFTIADTRLGAPDGTDQVTGVEVFQFADRTISVTDPSDLLNAPPAFTSGSAASLAENTGGTAYQASASDPEGAALTYSLSGTDAALFDIDAATGAVTFKVSPDFESPDDAGANNVYDVIVTASEQGGLAASQAVAISVTNANEAPVNTTAATASFAENGTGTVFTAAATDVDAGTTLTYALSGMDAALFAIDAATGAVTFRAAPNYEVPTDTGADNVYDVAVIASDGALSSSTRAVAITVTNVNEAPVIAGGATRAVTVNENQTAATTIAATDPDAGTTLTYSIVGGADRYHFAINSSTGVLSFIGNRNAEAPGDTNRDSVYDVQVQASDGTLSTTQTLSVTVASVNEAPTDIRAGTPTAIAITNAGFEATALTDGQFWSVSGHGWTPSSGNAGFYNMRADQNASQASEGINTTYVNGNSSLSQTLAETLAANTTYQLTVDVGNRQDVVGATATGRIELYAGGTLIGTAAVGTPPEGGWSTVKLEVDTATISDPALIGQPLTITLANGIGTQINFDNVRLDRITDPTVAENSAAGTIVTTLSGSDPDGNALTYSIVDANGSAVSDSNFEIVGNQLVVKSGAVVDYESGATRSLHVQATDTAGLSYREQLTVIIGDQAEHLALTSGNDSFTDTGVAELSIDGGAGDDSITAFNLPVTNLLTNGSFENGTTGWTFTGVVSPYTYTGATQGSYSAAFGGGNAPGGSIQQAVTTTAGTAYALAFDYRLYGNSNNWQSQQVQVVSGGVTVYTGTFSTNSFWAGTTINFMAQGANTTITFTDISPSSINADGAIGNVRLTNITGNILIGGAGADTLSGGTGYDTLSYAGSSAAVTVDLSGTSGAATGGDASGDVISNVENLTGSDFADRLAGDANDNVLTGGAGGDALWGNAGNDTLDGGADNDRFYGGNGNDVLIGGTSNGIANNDPYAYATATGLTYNADTGSFYKQVLTPTIWDVANSAAAATLINGVSGHLVRIDNATEQTAMHNIAPGYSLWTGGSDFQSQGAYRWQDGGIATDKFWQGNVSGTAQGIYTGWQGGDPNNAVGEDYVAVWAGSSSGNWVDTYNSPQPYAIEWEAGSVMGNLLDGGAGADTLTGGSGIDTASYNTSSAGVTVNLATNVNTGGDAAGDSLSGIENIQGSRFADTLTGDGSANIIWAGEGDDTLVGGAGADVLNGGAGRDTADYSACSAGINVNTFTAGYVSSGGDAQGDVLSGIENIIGSNFDDVISEYNNTGTTANTYYGLGGNDTITYGAGTDTIYGGDGNDTITGESWNWGSGTDYLDGGAGNDAIFNGMSDSTILGGDGNDYIVGGLGADIIDGGAGDDYIYAAGDGAPGRNGINVADGANIVDGGTGNDTIYGSGSADVLRGGDDTDVINAGSGDDTLGGGTGTDTAVFIGTVSGYAFALDGSGNVVVTDNTANRDGTDTLTGIETLQFSDGSYTLQVASGAASYFGTVLTVGSAGNDLLLGSALGDTYRTGGGNDRVFSGNGNDRIEITAAGSTYVDGGAGTDIVVNSGNTGWTVDLTNQANNAGFAAGSTFLNVEGIYGGGGNDSIVGNATSTDLRGGGGNDSITAGGIATFLAGDGGNDTLIGGSQNDTLYGGQGADALDGGGGSNWALYDNDHPGGAVTVNLATGTGTGGYAQGDTLTNIQNVSGTTQNDTLIGDNNANILYGSGGDDILSGGGGDDQLLGDSSYYYGALTGNDTYTGGGGNDTIYDAQGSGDVAIYSGNRSDYTITYDGGSGVYTIVDNRSGSPDGTDAVKGVETFQFADLTITPATPTGLTNAPPVFTSGATANFAENGTGTVYTATATDPDAGTTLTYSLSGTDAALFDINAATGVVTFKAAPDHEAPADAGGNNVYDVTLLVSDGVNVTTQAVAITVSDTAEHIALTAGDDVFTDTGVAELSVSGGAGNDTLTGSSGSDSFLWTAGDGNDVIHGGAGSDTFTLDRSTTEYSEIGIFDSAQAALYLGGSYPAGSIVISVASDLGNEILILDGVEKINIVGDSGEDNIVYVRGDVAGAGLTGDWLDLSGASQRNVSFELSDGADQFVNTTVDAEVYGLDGNDIITTGAGSDGLYGGAGDDQLSGGDGDDYLEGGAGADVLYGGAGLDSLNYTGSASGVTVNLATGSTSGGDAAGDTISGFERISGSIHADSLTGDSADNSLSGNEGDDILVGRDGNDLLYGGGGNDLLIGGAGNDFLVGHGGIDTASYADASSGVSVTLVSNLDQDTIGAGIDRLDGVENLVGSGFGDTLTGNGGANVIAGGAGNDTISGGAGTDTAVFSGNWADYTVSYDSGTQTYTVTSAADGTDTLTGIESFQFADGTRTAANVINTAPVITSGSSVNFVENGSGSAYQATATDVDGTALTYSITGTDAALFTVNATTGAISFNASPDYEAPVDSGGNNVHNLTLHVSDGNLTTSQAITIQVTDAGEALTLTTGNDFFIDAGVTETSISAGDGNDVVIGTTSADVIDGGAGNDTISANFGDDRLTGGAGNDTITGNEGTDTAVYADASTAATFALNGSGNLTVTTAADGTDTLTGVETLEFSDRSLNVVLGTHSNSSATGTAGADVIVGGDGIDTLTGGGGNDIILGGASFDTLAGGAGDDFLSGGSGSDTVTYAGASNGVTIDLNLTTAQSNGAEGADTLTGIEDIIGSGFDDVLIGDGAMNGFTGGQGNDTIIGGGGNDRVTFAGNYRDYIITHDSGTDTYTLVHNVAGGTGTDTVNGVETYQFADFTFGVSPNNPTSLIRHAPVFSSGTIATFAENGTGTAYQASATDADGNALTYSLSGTDAALFNINAATGVVTFKVSPNYEAPADADANNVYDIGLNVSDGIYTTTQAVAITVGDAAEALTLTSGNDSYTETGIAETSVDGGAGNDVLTGSTGQDMLLGGDGDDQVYGGDGADTLLGGAGGDLLIGEAGDDTLDGGDGGDNLVGGAGADHLDGGAGYDYARYDIGIASGAVEIDLAAGTGTGGAAEGDTFSSIEGIGGSSFDDTLRGDSGDNYITGSGGADLIQGGAGNDELYGHNNWSDSDDADTIDGGDGDDTINSGGGNDTLIGGAGNDVLTGGAGNDTAVLSGNFADYAIDYDAGSQTFTITDGRAGSPDGTDTVTGVENFQFADGTVAATSMLQVNPPVVETFEDGSMAGWSGGALLTTGGAFSTFLTSAAATADWAVASPSISGIEDVSKTFVLSGEQQSVTITFTFDCFASWDNEDFLVFADGAIISRQTYRWNDTAVNGDATADNAAGTDLLFNSSFDDQTYSYSITVATTADSLRLGFGSTLDQDYWDEGWGVDNIVIRENADSASVSNAQGTAGGDSSNVSANLHTSYTGGQGADAISRTGTGNDIIYGGDGNDVIAAGAGSDVVFGGGGDDTISGGAGNDIVEGGNGADFIHWAMGDGNDTIQGGAGADTLVLTRTGSVYSTIDIYDSSHAAAALGGTYAAGSVVISASSDLGSEIIVLDGIEKILIVGDSDEDTLLSVHGDLTGTSLNADWLEFSGAAQTKVRFELSDGNDNFINTTSNAKVSGGAGNDVITTGAGEDYVEGGAGADVLDGGGGLDTLLYTHSASGVSVNLATGSASGGDAAGDSFSGFERIEGSSFADNLTGDSNDNSLIGNEGNDILAGGAGNDYIYGDGGDDLLIGGAGDDFLVGNGGIDTASYADNAAAVTVSLATNLDQDTIGAGIDRLDSVENLVGSAFGDTLTGNSSANVLTGGGGDDVISGSDGSDLFLFGAADGNDVVSGGFGGSWIDTIDLNGAGAPTGAGSWYIELDNGTIHTSNAANGTIDLGSDASGIVHFADNHSIAFDSIERVSWA